MLQGSSNSNSVSYADGINFLDNTLLNNLECDIRTIVLDRSAVVFNLTFDLDKCVQTNLFLGIRFATVYLERSVLVARTATLGIGHPEGLVLVSGVVRLYDGRRITLDNVLFVSYSLVTQSLTNLQSLSYGNGISNYRSRRSRGRVTRSFLEERKRRVDNLQLGLAVLYILLEVTQHTNLVTGNNRISLTVFSRSSAEYFQYRIRLASVSYKEEILVLVISAVRINVYCITVDHVSSLRGSIVSECACYRNSLSDAQRVIRNLTRGFTIKIHFNFGSANLSAGSRERSRRCISIADPCSDHSFVRITFLCSEATRAVLSVTTCGASENDCRNCALSRQRNLLTLVDTDLRVINNALVNSYRNTLYRLIDCSRSRNSLKILRIQRYNRCVQRDSRN